MTSRTTDLRWLAIAFVLGLSGCGSNPVSTWERITPPGGSSEIPAMEHGDTIALVLKSNTGPDGPQPVNQGAQRALETCIKGGLEKVSSPLILSALDDPRLRYRVEVKVDTALDTAAQVGQEGLGWGFGTNRLRHTLFSGELFDVKQDRFLGKIEVGATGKEEKGVGFLVIIPIVVVNTWANTEEEACQRFAFLLDATAGPRADRFVRCVSRGERKWSYQSKCDY